MKHVTLKRLREAMESRYYHEKPNDWVYEDLYNAFEKKFGENAPIKKFVAWFVENHTKNVVKLLSTNDGELTQVCIENGLDPHINNDRALLLAAEDGDSGSVASLKVLVNYKPSLQALENALNFTLGLSMGANPETEAILEQHIKIAKKETPEEKSKRAKSVPKGRVVFGLR